MRWADQPAPRAGVAEGNGLWIAAGVAGLVLLVAIGISVALR